MRRLERVLRHEACTWGQLALGIAAFATSSLTLLLAATALVTARTGFDVARFRRRRAEQRASRRFYDDCGSTRGRP